jgi:hypothetical protein
MQMRLGAPFPTAPEADRAQGRAFRAVHLLARLGACRGGRVGRSTDPVVALAAVPGLGARPFWTSPSLTGAYATGCGRSSACEGMTIKGRQFEINTGLESPCSTKAGHRLQLCSSCPVPADLDLIRGGIGTTASPWAPGSDGLAERACPKPGTAARATPGVGSDPNPASSTRARTTRADRHTRMLGLCESRFGPSRGRRANETGSGSDLRSAERTEAGSASGRKLSTRTRST